MLKKFKEDKTAASLKLLVLIVAIIGLYLILSLEDKFLPLFTNGKSSAGAFTATANTFAYVSLIMGVLILTTLSFDLRVKLADIRTLSMLGINRVRLSTYLLKLYLKDFLKAAVIGFPLGVVISQLINIIFIIMVKLDYSSYKFSISLRAMAITFFTVLGILFITAILTGLLFSR